MHDVRQLLIACQFGGATREDISNYIDSVVSGEEEYSSQIFEAYSPDIEVARKRLKEYLEQQFPDFDITSEDFVSVCRRELLNQLDRLLRDKISQHDFYGFFIDFESNLIFNNISTDFCGDLYNACDCMDENWNFLPNDYLIEEAKRVHAEITKNVEKTTESN